MNYCTSRAVCLFFKGQQRNKMQHRWTHNFTSTVSDTDSWRMSTAVCKAHIIIQVCDVKVHKYALAQSFLAHIHVCAYCTSTCWCTLPLTKFSANSPGMNRTRLRSYDCILWRCSSESSLMFSASFTASLGVCTGWQNKEHEHDGIDEAHQSNSLVHSSCDLGHLVSMCVHILYSWVCVTVCLTSVL